MYDGWKLSKMVRIVHPFIITANPDSASCYKAGVTLKGNFFLVRCVIENPVCLGGEVIKPCFIGMEVRVKGSPLTIALSVARTLAVKRLASLMQLDTYII